MTKLLTSTALIAMLAGPVLAQTTTEPATTTPPATTEAMPATTDTMPATTDTTPTATDTMPAADATATTTAAPMGTDMGFGYMADPTDMSAENFIGKNLYVAETDVDTTATYTDADADWDSIGEISDIVMTADGQVKGVLIDIGGFLGLGEKTVAVSMDQLRVIRDGDAENEYFIVFTSNRAALESAPEFEWPDRS